MNSYLSDLIDLWPFVGIRSKPWISYLFYHSCSSPGPSCPAVGSLEWLRIGSRSKNASQSSALLQGFQWDSFSLCHRSYPVNLPFPFPVRWSSYDSLSGPALDLGTWAALFVTSSQLWSSSVTSLYKRFRAHTRPSLFIWVHALDPQISISLIPAPFNKGWPCQNTFGSSSLLPPAPSSSPRAYDWSRPACHSRFSSLS